MAFLTPPKTYYTDYYDQSRFNMIWNISIVFILFMSTITLINLSSTSYNKIPNLIAILGGIGILTTLRFTKRYEIISRVISIGFFVLITITFFTLRNVLHYTTPMWMMMNILFTYFTLGNRWGTGILLMHFIGMVFYFTFRLEDNIAHLPAYTPKDILNFIIEYAICGTFIAYFLYQFVKSNRYAENKFRESNVELNQQNIIISKQNEEKEVMLKEIHHRVKNNLQVITSLLRLQSNEIEESSLSKEFNEAINRVNAMALIHEKMYQSDMLSNFDLKNYLTTMAKDLIHNYSVTKKIDLQINSDIKIIHSKTIVPLALIFNELISNSIKHGFKQTEAPLITVGIRTIDPNHFNLEYLDNGKWINNSKSSFGMELISTMTEQLDGEMKLTHDQTGTKFSFRLKNLLEGAQENI